MRELIRQYGDEPPEPPQCTRCKKPMFISRVTSDHCEFECRGCGRVHLIPRERDFDGEVITLAQDYLRLKAAVRLIHGEPVDAQLFIAVCKAKKIIAQVAKESPCP